MGLGAGRVTEKAGTKKYAPAKLPDHIWPGSLAGLGPDDQAFLAAGLAAALPK